MVYKQPMAIPTFYHTPILYKDFYNALRSISKTEHASPHYLPSYGTQNTSAPKTNLGKAYTQSHIHMRMAGIALLESLDIESMRKSNPQVVEAIAVVLNHFDHIYNEAKVDTLVNIERCKKVAQICGQHTNMGMQEAITYLQTNADPIHLHFQTQSGSTVKDIKATITNDMAKPESGNANGMSFSLLSRIIALGIASYTIDGLSRVSDNLSDFVYSALGGGASSTLTYAIIPVQDAINTSTGIPVAFHETKIFNNEYLLGVQSIAQQSHKGIAT